MKRFCVRCGKETNELVDSLCASCFSEAKEPLPLPREIVLDFDTRSGRIRVGRDWIPESDELFKDLAKKKAEKAAKDTRIPIESLKVGPERESDSLVNALVSFDAEVQGVKLKVSKKIAIKLHKTISDASMKLSSNYHEAIIQLRFSEAKAPQEVQRGLLAEMVRFLAEQKKKIELSEAVDIKKVRGGFDLFIGSKKAAKIVSTRFARKHSTRLIVSNTLLGTDQQGKTKYRFTFCVKV